MGVPVKVQDPNSSLKAIHPDFLEAKPQKMTLRSETFRQQRANFSADPSTSENSPTNNQNCPDFYEKPIYKPLTSIIKKPEPLLIDVKPKRKTFQNEEDKKKFIEGFTQKKKTELCKNWELNGSCRYGDNCSFAHGKAELKSKTHLNSNYKQKPCKQYLLKGVCLYGNRCQYLHREIKYYPEHRDFLLKNQKKGGLNLDSLINYVTEASLLKKMEKCFEKTKDVEKVLMNLKRNSDQRRLPVFCSLVGN